MRVISYESARATFLVPFEEVAPIAGTDGAAIIQSMVQKYSFHTQPNLSVGRDEINKNGLKFEGGKFEFEGEAANIQTLAIYNDGMNVDANTTDRALAFADQLLTYLRDEFGFRQFTSQPKIHFWSTIIIEFDKKVERLLLGHEKISAAINKSLQQSYADELSPCVVSRFDFSCDPADRKTPTPAPRLIIERRAGASFERERFFCGAPMRTREHLELLEAIDHLQN